MDLTGGAPTWISNVCPGVGVDEVALCLYLLGKK